MAKTQAKPVVKSKAQAKAKSEKERFAFLKFLAARAQWTDWALIGGLYIAILIFLKIYYPYPQTESDSGNYILSAITGHINGYRPYGYSGFMSFFHGISSDVRFLVTWQWFLTFISVAFFLFTIKFMFRSLPRIAFYTLCVCCIMNPSITFMDAYMMSDSLFTSLTLMFLTTAMWIIYSGNWAVIIAHLLILWWTLDTRYIGLFYPIITAAIFVWAFWKQFRWFALATALVPVLLTYVYYNSAVDKMKEEFGVETFSSFGGWQKANNGVAVLPYVKIDPAQITDPQMRSIHEIVRSFPDSFFNTNSVMEISFMWNRNYPGKACLARYIQQTGTPYAKAWAYMGTMMGDYGSWLQSHYFSAYFEHFLWPNFLQIWKVYDIADYREFAADANMKTLFTTDRDTYHYKIEFFKPLTPIRRICDVIVWIIFIPSFIIGLIMIKKLPWSIEQKLVVTLLVVFAGAFCGACTIASPIDNFRYMLPILYSQLAVPMLIISALIAGRKHTAA